MKHLIIAVSLTTGTLSGCAQLETWHRDASAPAGATAQEPHSPFPKSSSNIAGN
jgi:hypothetical protein